jgi:hypothetical protein
MDEWLSLTYGYNAYWWVLWTQCHGKKHDAIGSLSTLSAKESLVETKDYKLLDLVDEWLILTNKNHYLLMNPMKPTFIDWTLVKKIVPTSSACVKNVNWATLKYINVYHWFSMYIAIRLNTIWEPKSSGLVLLLSLLLNFPIEFYVRFLERERGEG